MTDTETPEAVTRDRPPRRAPRRPSPPARSASSVVVPVVGLLAFAGLVAVGFMIASSRRTSASPLQSALASLPIQHLPSIPHPHMPSMHMPSIHMPSFDLHWIGRLAVVSAAQAAISHLVQSALRTWK